MEITFFPDWGSNLVRWTQSPMLYHIAIKLACTARQYKCIIYLYPVTFSPSNLKFITEFLGVRESREMRLEEFFMHTCRLFTLGPASVAQLDAPSNWRPGGRGFNPRCGRQHSFVEIDHEIFSMVILFLQLIQEGQLSVSGERMCTILVNRLED